MKTRTLAGVLLLSGLLVHGGIARAQTTDSGATLFRVFLKDGGTLVSYGEVARVGDRVDWDRTERYAMSARSGRYIETQAENDYTELSNQISQTLSEVGQST